jgi:hypothetical protein
LENEIARKLPPLIEIPVLCTAILLAFLRPLNTADIGMLMTSPHLSDIFEALQTDIRALSFISTPKWI